MKRSIWLLLIAAWTLGVHAETVSSEMASAAASAWAARNAAFGAGSTAADVVSVCDPADASVVLWHQVSMEGGGMLVVAPVTEVEPVVMALDNDPGALPEAHPLKKMLVGDLRRRLQFLADGSEEARAWGEANQKKWARLTAGTVAAGAAGDMWTVAGFEKGGALTHWDQNADAYRLYTPSNAVCGSAAMVCSALVQAYAATNAAAVARTCLFDGAMTNCTTLAGAIDWTALDDELVGRVAYNAGVGVGMAWGLDASSAAVPQIAAALRNVFEFRHARAVSFAGADLDQAQLAKLVYNQVRAGVPVGLSVEECAVVVAGYGLDADEVARVRLFMGCGGAGDGWYALPMMADGDCLPGCVGSAVTMIAYADDDIVPVVGRVVDSARQPVADAALSIPGLLRGISADGNGCFGTRVPTTLLPEECTIICRGKEATYAIESVVAEGSDVAVYLAAALPAAFEFALLDCTVAYSLERAVKLAEKENKAVLRVSGVVDATNTAAVLDAIFRLDRENAYDFTNTFVYVFSAPDSLDGDGGEVSYGVYLPADLLDNRWQNRKDVALAYGYLTTKPTGTNVCTYTFAPATSLPVATTNDVGDAAGVTNAVAQAFQRVVEVGGRRFSECTSGIEVRVVATPEAGIDAGGVHTGADLPVAYDGFGTYRECFVPGTNVTFSCAREVTNETAGVVFGCAGWSMVVSNKTTGATSTTRGVGAHEVTVAFAADDVATLTWDYSQKVAVYTEVRYPDQVMTAAPAAISPGSGWYACGTPVMFTVAEPEVKVGLATWRFRYFTAASRPDGSIELSPVSILVPMDKAGVVEASYDSRAAVPAVPEVTATCAVTVTNYVWDAANGVWAVTTDAQVPDTVVYTREGQVAVANGGTASVLCVPAGVTVAATRYTTADGVEMEFCGVPGEAEDAETRLPVSRDLSERSTAVVEWAWRPVPVEPEPSTTKPVIDWADASDALGTKGEGSVTLYPAGAGVQPEDVDVASIEVPKGFKVTEVKKDDSTGDIVATIALDETVLTPQPMEGESSPLSIAPGAGGAGVLTVGAVVSNGVKGFWYTIYGSNDLVAWAPLQSRQAEGDGPVEVSIDVDPATEPRKFFKLGVTAQDPTASVP